MAPNIAAGEMDRFQIRLAEEARAAVVVITLRPLLTTEQRAKILDEFAVGSEFIEVEYQLRIQSGWQGIPPENIDYWSRKFGAGDSWTYQLSRAI